MGASVGEDLRASRRLRRRSDSASRRRGATRSVAPSGRPQIARIWFSNCEVTAPSIVQWPLLWTRGAISLNTGPSARRRIPSSACRHSRARRRCLRASASASAMARASLAGRHVGGAKMPPSCRLRGASQVTVSPSAPRQSRIENSASKCDEAFEHRRRAAHRVPGRVGVAGRRDPRLALAVIAEAAGLEDRGRADLGQRGVEPGAVVDRGEGRGAAAECRR